MDRLLQIAIYANTHGRNSEHTVAHVTEKKRENNNTVFVFYHKFIYHLQKYTFLRNQTFMKNRFSVLFNNL